MSRLATSAFIAIVLFCSTAVPLHADDRDVPKDLNSGNVAWMMTSAALVLMMTAPGLALFYCGLVRKKNVLSVMMQCFFLMGMLSLVWAGWGYSLAFGDDVAGGLVGDHKYVMLNNVTPRMVKIETKAGEAPAAVPSNGAPATTMEAAPREAVVPMYQTYGIPRSLHMVYQMMFFIITPALICGAFAERMKFSAMVIFTFLWATFVYCPLAHWVWSDNGFLNAFNANAPYGAFDFAGGTVVHISSGFSALVCAMMIGRRLGHGQTPMPPHNLTYTCIGAALLWVGWFGFNGGSSLAANAQGVNAFVATHLAAAAGVVSWAGAEWVLRGKASILGACSGAVAGLVCITPACGMVLPQWGIVMGFAAGLVCFYACNMKAKFGYDDALDAFGVHGVGGVLGALLTGVFATEAVIPGRTGPQGLLEGNVQQLFNQAVGVVAAAAIGVVGTALILKVIDLTIGLRVTDDEEHQGLDVTQHGEEGYIFQ